MCCPLSMSFLCNAIGGAPDKLQDLVTMVALFAFLEAAACSRWPHYGHSFRSHSLGLAMA